MSKHENVNNKLTEALEHLKEFKSLEIEDNKTKSQFYNVLEKMNQLLQLMAAPEDWIFDENFKKENGINDQEEGPKYLYRLSDLIQEKNKKLNELVAADLVNQPENQDKPLSQINVSPEIGKIAGLVSSQQLLNYALENMQELQEEYKNEFAKHNQKRPKF